MTDARDLTWPPVTGYPITHVVINGKLYEIDDKGSLKLVQPPLDVDAEDRSTKGRTL